MEFGEHHLQFTTTMASHSLKFNILTVNTDLTDRSASVRGDRLPARLAEIAELQGSLDFMSLTELSSAKHGDRFGELSGMTCLIDNLGSEKIVTAYSDKWEMGRLADGSLATVVSSRARYQLAMLEAAGQADKKVLHVTLHLPRGTKQKKEAFRLLNATIDEYRGEADGLIMAGD